MNHGPHNPKINSAPLSFAVVSAEDLAVSVAFYRDMIGFDVVAEGEAGPKFKTFIGLSHEVAVRTVLLRASGCDIGRLLLLEVDTDRRQRIRTPGDRTTRGLWNLNFYVADIRGVARQLSEMGFELWSEPVEYDLGSAGRAVEVLFDAPDGVAINLVQPLGDASVFTGRVKSEVEEFGYTRAGFSPIATTAHCVHSIDPAVRFYQDLLGLEVVLDEVLGKAETNIFLGRPEGAKSRTVFLSGGHVFGKLSLNEPMNYCVPERVAAAHVPNIGYLAQAFQTPSLEAALARVSGGDARHAQELDVVGLSATHAASLTCPGSGASAWILESSQ